MDTRKADRRILRTRRLLTDALMELVVERGFQDVTIQDIANRADVSRTTFYLHFRDKDELLFSTFVGMMDELVRAVGAGYKREDVLRDGLHAAEIDKADFEHVAAHAEFYRAILSEKGSPKLIGQIIDYLTQVTHESTIKGLIDPALGSALPTEFMAAWLAGAEVGLVRWWLNGNLQYTPEQMARMSFELCCYGLLWALRFPPPAISAATDASDTDRD
jgi:AcrR family transcriptional regulator